MDCRQILSASGDQRKGKGNNVIEVNEGTYVLKNRWTGTEDKQANREDNSGGSAKWRNNEEDLNIKKEVDFEPFGVPRENLDTRLRKLMSGDPESIPVFMWEYRADWIDSERKKRHQNKIKQKIGTIEKRSDDKNNDQKIKLESVNRQVSHVEQLFKNVKMSPDLPDKRNETRKGYELKNVKMSSDSSDKHENIKGDEMKILKISPDLSDKPNETRKANKMKNHPLEEQLRCDHGLIPNIEDLNESFTNPLNDNPIRDDNNEEMEHRPLIDDVEVDYIVRQFPLEKVSGILIKPSGLGNKLTSSSIKPSVLESSSIKPSGLSNKVTSGSIKPKDSKRVSAAIDKPLEEANSKENLEKNFYQLKEPEVKHVKDLKIDTNVISSEELAGSNCSTKMENYSEENVNLNEPTKVEPKHHIERVPSRKRKFTEVLGSIEDVLTKQTKLDIKEQIINDAFDKWWEEQELEHERKTQGLKTEHDHSEIL